MQQKLKLIRITEEKLLKIQKLSKRMKLKQITVLEYLLDGTIDLSKLK